MPGRSSSATRQHRAAGCATRRGAMAAWEDGRRTGKGPGEFERWYLDARTRLSEPLQQHGAPIPLCSQKLGFLRLTCRFCGASKRMARTATGDGPPSARKARSWFAVSCEASAVACLTITGAGLPSCPPHDGGYRRRLPGLQPCLAGTGAHDLLARSGLRGRPLHAGSRVRLLSPR